MSDEHTNRLIRETSPYLLQHAHNPVDWYPWGDEAFQKAKAENKPILLSIGYSACHWCHVMERESFENEKIAALTCRRKIGKACQGFREFYREWRKPIASGPPTSRKVLRKSSKHCITWRN